MRLVLWSLFFIMLPVTVNATQLIYDINYFNSCGSNAYRTTDDFGMSVCRCYRRYRPIHNRIGCEYDTCPEGTVFLEYDGSTPVCIPGTYTVYQTKEREDRYAKILAETPYEMEVFYNYTDNMWFAGNHVKQEAYDDPELDWFTDYIWGTDLGFAVELNGRIFVYFGDTFGTYAGSKTRRVPVTHPNCFGKTECNDAIVEINPYDYNPRDGISIKSVVTKPENPNRFHPIIIPGVHSEINKVKAPIKDSYVDEGEEKVVELFQVPSSATVIKQNYESKIVLSYKSELLENKEIKRTSWFGCSENGVDFENCYEKEIGYGKKEYYPFSKNKFVVNSLIFLSKQDMTELCNTNNDSILCRPAIDKNGGILVFGNGTVQNSPKVNMYLSFISIDKFGKLNAHNRPIAKYYNKRYNRWFNYETMATPIISTDRSNLFDPPIEYMTRVALIKKGGHNYFVLLQKGNGAIFYRTAKMANPSKWSQAEFTKADPNDPYIAFWYQHRRIKIYGHYGYGPSVIDKYTRFDGENLHLWHFISSWEGDSSSPYGTYTAETIIPWPPQ